MADVCPIDYDHNDDLDECMVCGWTLDLDKPQASGPKDMSTLTGPERIQEAVDRLGGAYAPTQRITFTCKENK